MEIRRARAAAAAAEAVAAATAFTRGNTEARALGEREEAVAAARATAVAEGGDPPPPAEPFLDSSDPRPRPGETPEQAEERVRFAEAQRRVNLPLFSLRDPPEAPGTVAALGQGGGAAGEGEGEGRGEGGGGGGGSIEGQIEDDLERRRTMLNPRSHATVRADWSMQSVFAAADSRGEWGAAIERNGGVGGGSRTPAVAEGAAAAAEAAPSTTGGAGTTEAPASASPGATGAASAARTTPMAVEDTSSGLSGCCLSARATGWR